MSDSNNPVIAVSKLTGAFGNHIFHYAFAKIYAMCHNFRIETSPWIGQTLFGHRDPPLSKQYPVMMEEDIFDIEHIFQYPQVANVDLIGIFQLHTSYYAPYKDYFCQLFQPVPEIRNFMESGMSRLRARGKTVVCIHLRRGDFIPLQNTDIGRKIWMIAPTGWYIQWLRMIWGTLEQPVLYVASDDLDSVLQDFLEFNPVTARDVFDPFPLAPYYSDYYVMTQCDALAISHSTFSFSASMLNSTAKLFFRPDLDVQGLIPYIPWNSHVNQYLPLRFELFRMIREGRVP